MIFINDFLENRSRIHGKNVNVGIESSDSVYTIRERKVGVFLHLNFGFSH